MNLITISECDEYVLMKPATRQDDTASILPPPETTAQEKDHEMTANLVVIEQVRLIIITFSGS